LRIQLLEALESKERAELENEVRKTLAEILGGVVILTGIYFSWETLKETRREVKVNQENTQETLRIAREGHITERFTKAIEQLGKHIPERDKPKSRTRLPPEGSCPPKPER
jgi:hypothetical protein